MVFTFLKARGQGVGSSLVEEDKLELAKELEEKAAKAGVQIILPSDLIVADAFAADANTQVVSADAIPDGWMGLDNGPEATIEIQAALREVGDDIILVCCRRIVCLPRKRCGSCTCSRVFFVYFMLFFVFVVLFIS